MVRLLPAWLAHRVMVIGDRPDRGAETVEVVMWVAIAVGIVGLIGGLLRNTLIEYWQSVVTSLGL